jgi:D-alanyl-lipoteichoic acid acyltransferase DltB (MBOAT superfamily)
MWRVEYLPLLVGSVVGNALLARALGPGRRWNRSLLAAGVTANLGLLFWFKYASFASTQLVAAGLISRSLPAQVLPLAISFYTFQQIAYLVDVSRGDVARVSLLRHLLFVSFFPHLIAGPITHPATIIPQLDRLRPTWQSAALGLFIVAIGLAKKVVLADPLGKFADPGFAHPESLAQVSAVVTVLAYTMQLYFDFSGYSDMAVGLGLFFGVQLPWNFLSPYKARNISEFWRRWHVTLSDFLKNYVYVPLGGSRQGPARTVLNLLIVMLLGGIWHGAGWTFVVWGLLHGVALAAFHVARPFLFPIPAIVARLCTMTVVIAGWVCFRSASLPATWTMVKAVAGVGELPRFIPWDRPIYRALPYLVVATLIALFAPNTSQLSGRFGRSIGWTLWGAILLMVSMLYMLGQVTPPEFLYFDF